MTYRVLCDENVDPRTVRYLETDGHTATTVTEALDAGVEDADIAAFALENDYLVLTSDTDFLDDGAFSDTSILYCPDETASGHRLAEMVSAMASYCPKQTDLPRVSYLTDELL